MASLVPTSNGVTVPSKSAADSADHEALRPTLPGFTKYLATAVKEDLADPTSKRLRHLCVTANDIVDPTELGLTEASLVDKEDVIMRLWQLVNSKISATGATQCAGWKDDDVVLSKIVVRKLTEIHTSENASVDNGTTADSTLDQILSQFDDILVKSEAERAMESLIHNLDRLLAAVDNEEEKQDE